MYRRIVIGLIIFVCIIGAIIGVREFLSYKEVSIVLKQQNLAIDIYSENETKISSVSNDTKTKLKTGTYYYIPTSERHANDKIYFKVSDDEVVEINPSFSYEILATILTQEKDAIILALSTTYPTTISNYIIADEFLANQGEWYGAKLMQRVSGGNQPDVYRVILKKTSSGWEIAVSPRLSISISEFPQIPASIIRQTNESPSNGAYDLLYPM